MLSDAFRLNTKNNRIKLKPILTQIYNVENTNT